MLDKLDTDTTPRREAVVIKKYANRRLYNTETSSYVTLEDLAQMVRSDKEFVVYDAKSGDDLTHSVLTQIIVEQESRSGGQALLPIPFLRQLIRFYDDSLARMVPGYLQMSLETLTREQERFRSQIQTAWGGNAWGANAFEAYQEHTRRNLALFEQAMRLWTPFGPGVGISGGTAEPHAAPPPAPMPMKPTVVATSTPPSTHDDIEDMKSQLAAMQARIEKMSQQRS
jgi:polyhydroxyalkanoate synthesis repressor PhaR